MSFTVLVPPGRRVVHVDASVRADPGPGQHAARFGPLDGTSPARTILELAVDLADDDAVQLAADRLRWRCRVTGTDLARVAEDLPDHPGVPRLERLGLLTPSLPESPGERDTATFLASIGIEVEWQVHLAPDLRVDALCREANLVIEHDGPTHGDDRDRVVDAARDRRIEGLGFQVVHITAADLRHPDALARRLRRLVDEGRAT